jgi:hypothetical protein
VKTLKLADHLALPADEAVTQKYGFIGRSGSGKSYASMKLAELFLGAGAQIIALDWVGIWWSLRLAAGGKAPGFEHVYIFGGEHADVPLEPTSGALMADLIVDKHISVVLDVMHFRKAERTRFATAFAEQFFHRKKTARTACHLFIEEAQAYLPQMVRGEEARMVGVFEDIGKVGRNYGIGTSLISQRPQAINKDVLNQVEVLLAFQTNGPQERKAIAGWTSENTAAGAVMMQELPALPVGDALVWSPQWLRLARRVHIAPRDTYNASSTPTQQAKTIAPKRLAKDDLDAIAADLAATIEKAKADDPKELRRQLAAVRAELVKAQKVTHSSEQASAVSTTVEILTDADRELLAKARTWLADHQTFIASQAEAIDDRLRAAMEAALDDATKRHGLLATRAAEGLGEFLEKKGLTRILEKLDRVTVAPSGNVITAARTLAPSHQLAPAASIAARPSRGIAPQNADRPPVGINGHGVAEALRSSRLQVVGALPGPEQKILNAVAELEVLGLHPADKIQVGLLAGYTNVRSGGFSEPLGRLVAGGYVVSPQPGKLAITDAGRAAAVVDAAPTTADEMQARVMAKLTGPEQKMLRAIVRRYPTPITKEDLGAECGYTNIRSGGFSEPLGRLNTLGIVRTPARGSVVAAPFLFLEA